MLPEQISSLDDLTPEQQDELRRLWPDVYAALAESGDGAYRVPTLNAPGYTYVLGKPPGSEEPGGEDPDPKDPQGGPGQGQGGERPDIAPPNFSFSPLSGDPQDPRGVGQAASGRNMSDLRSTLSALPSAIRATINAIRSGQWSKPAPPAAEDFDSMLAAGREVRAQRTPGAIEAAAQAASTPAPGANLGLTAVGADPNAGAVAAAPSVDPNAGRTAIGMDPNAGAVSGREEGDVPDPGTNLGRTAVGADPNAGAVAAAPAAPSGAIATAAQAVESPADEGMSFSDHAAAIGQGLAEYAKQGGWMGIAAKGVFDAFSKGEFGPARAMNPREARGLAVTKRNGVYTRSAPAPTSISWDGPSLARNRPGTNTARRGDPADPRGGGGGDAGSGAGAGAGAGAGPGGGAPGKGAGFGHR